MVNYTFSTNQGWRVTEYRPFSPSYAVLHTPGFNAYQHADNRAVEQPDPESPTGAYTLASGNDLLGTH